MSPEELTEFEQNVYFEIAALRDASVNDMVKQAYKKYYRDLIGKNEVEKLPYLLQEVVKKIGIEPFSSSKKSSKWFITISAKDPVDHVKFLNQMQKCILKDKLKGTGVYVIEQRSQGDENPYGWHIHWRVEFANYASKSIISQQIFQCFKLYLAGANYVDMKPWNDNQLAYLDGKKTEDKLPKVEKDRVLRKRFGFLEKYSY